ncbi:MAG: hypothetical protein IGS54_03500 [Elainella sp. C42_A2020_010]|nr:hypothetical protein [Elainella sp. C42_A2020_010]
MVNLSGSGNQTGASSLVFVGGCDNSAGFWHFRGLEIDNYRVGFTYHVIRPDLNQFPTGARMNRVLEWFQDFWIGMVIIPDQTFQIALAEGKA